VVHHLDLKERELGVWWNALAACEGQTQTSTINAAKFIALTLCRKTEVLNSTWGEIEGLDGDAPVFVIPAGRMKMKRDHIVPLTKQAVAILQAQAASATAAGRDIGNDDYIFTTLQSPKKPIDHSTLNALFNRVAAVEGCEFIRDADTGKSTFSPHGLRSSATTILVERGYSLAIVDLLLAHSARGVIASYNRAEQLPTRRAALAFYADLVDELAAVARGDNVVLLKAA
jgi:integrase